MSYPYRESRIGQSRYTPRSGVGCFAVFIVVAILVVLTVGLLSATHVTTHSGCRVNDKDRTTTRDGSSDMRVYTDNCGVFQVKDSWLSWTFSSSDTYSKIQVGHVYNFKTRGYRIPFFSSFPNIVGAEEIS